MKSVLVTGGAGFIGCSLAARLLADDPALKVVAVDNLHPQVHPERVRPARLPAAVRLVVADVCEDATWPALLDEVRPDAIVHLAAETGTGQSLTAATRHAMVNVVGLTTLLDALARSGRLPTQILLASSRAIYGEGRWVDDGGESFYPGQRSNAMLSAGQWDFRGLTATPFTAATTRPSPTSVYASTKLAQEHVLANWCAAFNVKARILRLQNVYGPGQSLSNPYTGIVPLFGRYAREGRSIPLYEDGAMLRDFVFIEDVSAALASALRIPGDLPRPLDIGTGKAITIAELAATVAAHYGAPPPHVCGLFRDGDVRHAACQIDEACARLGWQPRTDVKEGVSALCRWIDEELPR